MWHYSLLLMATEVWTFGHHRITCVILIDAVIIGMKFSILKVTECSWKTQYSESIFKSSVFCHFIYRQFLIFTFTFLGVTSWSSSGSWITHQTLRFIFLQLAPVLHVFYACLSQVSGSYLIIKEELKRLDYVHYYVNNIFTVRKNRSHVLEKMSS